MTYTAADRLPTLYLGQWGRLNAPNPTLSAPLAPTDTTAYFSTPLTDRTGAVVTDAVLFGVKNSDSYVMGCYIAPNGIAADGLSATIVQGIRFDGLDYTTSDSSLIPSEGFSAGDSVFVNIQGVWGALMVGALRGAIATNGLGFIMGDGTASNVTISHKDNTGTLGFLRKNPTTSKVQYSNDGTNWVNIDSVSASNLVTVSAGDTTPGYLNVKLLAGNGITLTKENAGANEDLKIAANGPLATMVSDVLVSATQINTAVNAYGALSTYNLAVGNYPGGGKLTVATYGDTVSASDISNNRVLLYEKISDGHWYKYDNTIANAQCRLGLALEATNSGSTGRVLLEGDFNGQTFANVNPTFSNTSATGDLTFGQSATNFARAFRLDNSAGAECVLTGSSGNTVSIKNGAGSPTSDIKVRFWLGSSAAPYCYYQGGNDLAGLMLASGTINHLLTSGTYANISFTFTGFNVPAGSYVWVTFDAGGVDASNYYSIQGSSSMVINQTNTGTWSGTPGLAGRLTLGVTSTSPVGYAVCAYDPVAATSGQYSIFKSLAGRQIGKVTSATSMYFNPNHQASYHAKADNLQIATGPSGGAYNLTTATIGFRPGSFDLHCSSSDATASNPYKVSRGYWDASNTDHLVVGNGYYVLAASTTYAGQTVYTYDAASAIQCGIWPLENGFYKGPAYPGNGSAAGAAPTVTAYETLRAYKV